MANLSSFKYLPLICSALKYPKYCHKTFFQGIANQKDTFKFSDLEITLAEPSQRRAKPKNDNILFGKQFSDHMFEVEWTQSKGWGAPCICPIHDFSLHPASKVFHYAQELFEGMKAHRGTNGKILLFRPNLNMQRMLKTAERTALPLFDGEELLKCLKKLVSIDQDWVPDHNSCSMYIRPTYIGIEPSLGVAASNKALLYIITGPVGPYFSTGVRNPVSLFADPKYVRAWPGGVGNRKMGSNYGPTIYVQKEAEKKNLHQVLWLYGEDHELTEVGTMNIFIYLINNKGEKELVTPPLNDTILPGIVRQSLLDLAKEWGEFKVSERSITMKEVILAQNENRLLEIFGSGTACVVCPVDSISYLGQKIFIPTMDSKDAVNLRFFNTLTDIQNGKISSEWTVPVD